MMTAKPRGARSVHEIGQRVRLDDAEIDEKVVRGSQGDLVIFLVRIEIEKCMSGIFKLHEVATVATFAVSFGKPFGEFEGNDTVCFGVEDEARGQSFLREMVGWAVKFTILDGGEAIVADSLGRGVTDGSKEDEGLWLG